MHAAPPAIQATNLCKSFGKTLAVNQVNFTVPRGKTVALLGGNGAGKTTTLSMILGLVTPSSGDVKVLGHDMARDPYAVLPRMNFESPYVDLPKRLSVEQNLKVYAHLYGVRNVKTRIAQLADELALTELMHRPLGTLSAGQKTRASLAKALINEPDLLLLDEPTASLDPDTADWVRRIFETYRYERNASILLASHNMQEVERLADYVLMMREGRIEDQGTPVELIGRYGRDNLEEVFLDVARGSGWEEELKRDSKGTQEGQPQS